MSRRPSVVIVGGGLAGIAAAVRLSRSGWAVTLVETRKRLGGRATSFVDPTTGQVLDNCQHVLLGCCTNLMQLYRLLGVDDQIQWHRRLYFVNADGLIDELEADDLPAPMHLTRALAGFGSFSWAEKAAIARAMLAMMRLTPAQRQGLHDTTFAQWLAQHHQPAGAKDRFWSVIITSALNQWPGRVSAFYAVQVFLEGFLAHPQAYLMGLPAVALVELYDQAQQVITKAGGRVLLSASAERFEFNDRQIAGLGLADGGVVSGDVYISAVPFDRLLKLVGPSMVGVDPRLDDLHRLEVSPIIGIHLWVTRTTRGGKATREPVMRLPHLILTQSPLHWIFNKGIDHTGPEQVQGCQHLHGVISAADDLVDQPAEKIVRLAMTELGRVLRQTHDVCDLCLVHARVIKEKRATFAVDAGVEPWRPPASLREALSNGSSARHNASPSGGRGIENLYLAGDWCRTGWPATMEGAVRSGYLAASAVMHQRQANPQDLLVADLPSSALYRLLSR